MYFKWESCLKIFRDKMWLSGSDHLLGSPQKISEGPMRKFALTPSFYPGVHLSYSIHFFAAATVQRSLKYKADFLSSLSFSVGEISLPSLVRSQL